MKSETLQAIENFFRAYPHMEYLKEKVLAVVKAVAAVNLPNKIMTCGNGGSFADAGHIVGELMKSFKRKRPVDSAVLDVAGAEAAEKLEGAIPAVCLGESSPLSSAIANDIGGDWVYAQQVYGLGCAGDILVGLSTSGNAQNVLRAMQVAKGKNILTVAFTGKGGGKLKDACDVLLNVPETETYRVQELHLPLYHLICACAEIERW